MDFNGLKDKLLSALGQASEGAKEFAGKAADATKDFAEKAADKAKAGTRIAKLNIEIAQQKENMKKAYLEMGKLYYDTHKDNPDELFNVLCEEIAAAEKAVAEREAEIEDLKNGGEPDVDVEFEEVVEQAETAAEEGKDAAEACCDCAGEAAEECKDAVEDCCEKAKDCCETVKEELKDEFHKIGEEIKDVVEEIKEKLDD